MLRTIAVAILFGVVCSTATAVPQRQLVAPNLNPALRTVPFIPHTYYAGRGSVCERQLVGRVDSGTVITGPNGRVAHIMGMADGGAGMAEIAVTSISADGLTATADFVACASPTWISPAPVSATMPLTGATLESVAIRAKSNSITLKTR